MSGAILRSGRSLPTHVSGSDVYDLVVVGAGMVGAALAALLRNNSLTSSMCIAILDQRPPPLSLQLPEFPGLRVSTLTPASIRVLQEGGAWDEVAPPRSSEFARMQVWDHAGPGYIRWDACEAGVQRMGVVAENDLIQAALLRAATGAAGSKHHPAGASSSARPAGSGEAAAGVGRLGEAASPGKGVELVFSASVRALRLPPYGSGSGASSSPYEALFGSESGAEGPNSHPPRTGAGGSHPQPHSSSSSSSAGSTSTFTTSSSSRGIAEVELADGRVLRSRLVVGADGARSHVRALSGLRTAGWAYGQRGLVATVSTSPAYNDTAWQRFLPTGPLALLPVRNGLSNVVWSTSPEEAARLERLGPQEFAAAANEALQGAWGAAEQEQQQQQGGAGGALGALASAAGSVLQPLTGALSGIMPGSSGGGFIHSGSDPPRVDFASAAGASGYGAGGGVAAAAQGSGSFQAPPLVVRWVGSAPRSFPLHLQHAGRYVRPRLALIGDAAHAVHPLAGQGVNLGLGDAAALAQALAFAREVGQDIGDGALLQERYEAPRQAANMTMMAALDILQRVFGVGGSGASATGGPAAGGPAAGGPAAMVRALEGSLPPTLLAQLGAARAAGLGVLNASGPLKNQIMRYAMGV